MQTRELGTQGLRVSALGLGCMGMSAFYGERDDERVACARSTARSSSASTSSTPPTCTARAPTRSWSAARSPAAATRSCSRPSSASRSTADDRRATRGVDGTPEYVRRRARRRCERLGIDHIDLYYQHRVDPNTPIEETVGAMAELVAAGQGPLPRPLRGGAGDDPPRARRAPDHRPADRVLAVDARPRGRRSCPTCASSGIGFVAYSPLGRGFLTGALQVARRPRRGRLPPHGAALPGRELRAQPRARREGRASSPPRRASRRRSSRSPGCSPRASDIVPIPGTKRARYLEENVGGRRRRADRRRTSSGSPTRCPRPPASAIPRR